MVGCVALSEYWHTEGMHKCKMRRSCVLNTALDLAAAALCIDWGLGGGYVGLIYCKVCDEKRWVFEYGLCLGRRRSGMLGVG